MANSKIWDNRIVGYDNLDPRVIKANESNWKRHPPKQREKMLVMLNTIGWVQDVIINKTSGKMVDGHLRVDLAIQAGEATVPVKYVELTEDQEISILTMMDTITSMAVVDFEKYTALVIKTEAEEETPLKQLMKKFSRANRWNPIIVSGLSSSYRKSCVTKERRSSFSPSSSSA